MDREEDDPVGEGDGLTPGVDLSALFASLASSEDGFGGCKIKFDNCYFDLHEIRYKQRARRAPLYINYTNQTVNTLSFIVKGFFALTET